jgi:hypothetical protein
MKAVGIAFFWVKSFVAAILIQSFWLLVFLGIGGKVVVPIFLLLLYPPITAAEFCTGEHFNLLSVNRNMDSWVITFYIIWSLILGALLVSLFTLISTFARTARSRPDGNQSPK